MTTTPEARKLADVLAKQVDDADAILRTQHALLRAQQETIERKDALLSRALDLMEQEYPLLPEAQAWALMKAIKKELQ